MAGMLVPRDPGAPLDQVVDVHPSVSEPWAAGLLALGQAGEVCWRDGFRGALPPRLECGAERVVDVLVGVHPAWPNPYAVPGDRVAQVDTEEGILVVVRMSAADARAWLESYEADPREESAVREFYCVLTGCGGKAA